ncbi:MAG: pseudouridine synthase family protein [Eubacterium sp.]|nr:pseudouridine synthase family protein [Eubacterium sp.]
MTQMRLQKYLAHAGVASRRASEELIRQGRVEVNGKVVTDMGISVLETDSIRVDGKNISNEQQIEDKVYIVLNKPAGYVSSARDQFGRPTVVDLVQDINSRLYPVGRLDYDTSGLIILTNDGDFTYRLTHPKHEIDKVYEALVSGIPSKSEIERFESGLEIEDYVTAPAKLSLLSAKGNNAIIRVTIHEGKNRQVRKMCEAIGHKVLTLKRISIGPIALKNLPEGKWRRLSPEEVKSLYQ